MFSVFVVFVPQRTSRGSCLALTEHGVLAEGFCYMNSGPSADQVIAGNPKTTNLLDLPRNRQDGVSKVLLLLLKMLSFFRLQEKSAALRTLEGTGAGPAAPVGDSGEGGRQVPGQQRAVAQTAGAQLWVSWASSSSPSGGSQSEPRVPVSHSAPALLRDSPWRHRQDQFTGFSQDPIRLADAWPPSSSPFGIPYLSGKFYLCPSSLQTLALHLKEKTVPRFYFAISRKT